MPQYLFGFNTYSIHEPGTLLAAGTGEEVLKATTENVGKFTRLMTMTNPDMLPAYIPETPKPKAPVKIESEPQPIESPKFEHKKRR